MLSMWMMAHCCKNRTLEAMSFEQHHAALSCKVQGTWNLHTVAYDLSLDLTFFTMLSSISVNLGIVESVGYFADHDDAHQKASRDATTWAPISERQLRQIFEFSVYQ
ncbi:hypothetical protein ACCO45_005146 [Purpureocillium lilacinum]|uniref:Uncharacterized protein n=1 Tax=Purpureocillium lilacinum TaxID=33203 RepID=A0ACC4DWV6_PURLI